MGIKKTETEIMADIKKMEEEFNLKSPRFSELVNKKVFIQNITEDEEKELFILNEKLSILFAKLNYAKTLID